MIIDDLHEFNYLDFEHIKLLNLAEIRQMAEDFWQKPSNFQDSEQTDSFVNFVQRVKNVRTFFDNLPNGTYVVFTHGMWLGMLIWQVLHADGKRVFNQQKFREFELAIRPKNCEVFLLKDNTVAKVRVRTDGDDVDIRKIFLCTTTKKQKSLIKQWHNSNFSDELKPCQTLSD